MRNRSRVLVTAIGLVLLAGAAEAQSVKPAKALPVMRGSIQDTLGSPLEGAMIEIAGLNRRITTPASGSYRFDDIKPGKYWIIARRIGYAPIQTALTFNQGDDREINFQLQSAPHILPEVMVKAERIWKRKYQDFVWRSKGAFGYFLTRDDLEKSRAHYLGDVVRRYLPWVRSENYFTPAIADRFGFGTSAFRRSSVAQRDCSPAVSVNGGMPSGTWAVNDFRAQEVEAVEVYRAERMMPVEFGGWGARCGLVVVWTQ
jgi:hypothetical protein